MDYKYIEQLLERYWQCQTTLQEEEILRSFFSQQEIPAHLQSYRPLFAYANQQKEQDTLGEEFDKSILQKVESHTAVKAQTIRLPQRLRPLFKAAAVVAILLTLGNAMQVAYEEPESHNPISTTVQKGASVADAGDSAKIDTTQHRSMADPVQSEVIIK